MKKYFYLLGILGLTASCGTATYMYDDVYDVAEGKSLTEEGYTDLIKDNEKDHKVVVDKKDKVTFGGYYPSNNQLSGGTSFSNTNNNCNCSCGHYPHSNQWRYVQPGWTYGNPNSLWFNSCSCNHWNNNLAYHYINFGNSYNLYGYYDYWGGWHNYYPLGMDPYGYYAAIYGWYPYQWNNGNNGIFNGVYNSYDNTADNGNHFYGHRNSSSTSSSNTTVYAHTVKQVISTPVSTTNQSVTNVENSSGLTIGSTGISNKPAFATEGSTMTSQPFGTGLVSDPNVVSQSQKPISTNTGAVSGHAIATTSKDTYAGGITSTTATSSGSSHVAASNQFEVKYPTGTAARNGSGQSSGTQHVDPVNQNSGTPNYYTPPVVTNSSGYSSTNSTSRSTSTTYNSTNTNTTSNTSNAYSGSNSTTSHRSSTTTTNSGSSSSTNSGGSRSTSTSRR